MTSATRWGLTVLACGIAVGALAGTATAVALGAVLGCWAEQVKTFPVGAVIDAP